MRRRKPEDAVRFGPPKRKKSGRKKFLLLHIIKNEPIIIDIPIISSITQEGR
jgi:hypothetical protein